MSPRRALIVCVALTILHTWPLSVSPASRSLNYNADAQQWEWTLSWMARAIVRQPLRLFDGNIFAPERNTLALSDPVLIPALLAAPVRWLGGSPVLTFNLSVLTGLVLTAWAGWFVVWRWTGSAAGALVAAALTAFNVHLLTRLSHVQAVHAWPLPLGIYVLHRLSFEPRWRDAGWLALIVAAAASTSAYLLVFLLLIVAVFAIVAIFGATRWRSLIGIGGGLAAGFLLALPVLLPYLRVAQQGATRPLEIVATFSASPAAFVTSLSRLNRLWTASWFVNDTNVLFAGFTALALAILGLADRRCRRVAVPLFVITVAGAVLAFGPATPLYRWLYEWCLPLRGIRAAFRFGYVYLLGVALLAGLGGAALERRLGDRRPRIVVCLALLMAVTVEAWSGPVATLPFTRLPGIYASLPAAPADVLLVEVPFYPTDAMFENGEYMLNATVHWRPVMNGYSGAIPDSYRRRAVPFWFFPEGLAIDAMKREGATHVMVHLERLDASEAEDWKAALQTRPDLRLIASDARGHRLYLIGEP